MPRNDLNPEDFRREMDRAYPSPDPLDAAARRNDMGRVIALALSSQGYAQTDSEAVGIAFLRELEECGYTLRLTTSAERRAKAAYASGGEMPAADPLAVALRAGMGCAYPRSRSNHDTCGVTNDRVAALRAAGVTLARAYAEDKS